MRNSRLDESQAGIKISKRNNNNLNDNKMADDIILMAESKEGGTKERLYDGERGE